jgi:hypothetical protein
MLVPEASMHEDRFFPAPKNQIGFSWKIARVKPVAVTHCMNEMPDEHLRLRILAADTPHIFGAARRCKTIHH